MVPEPVPPVRVRAGSLVKEKSKSFKKFDRGG
jgi:hypothetical protein